MKHTKILWAVTALALVLGGCSTTDSAGSGASSAAQSATQPAAAAPYFTGEGGKGMSVTILPLKDTGLAEDQNYLPGLVQGEFVSNFKTYSAIEVLDRVRLDEQYAELLSGYWADDAEVGMDLGHLAPTDYLLGGTIIKTATGYAMQIQITKSADKMTAASYSGTCTFLELDNLTGIRRASLDLLAKMGVEMTERTRTELSSAAAAHEVQGQTALAQGVIAQRGGTVVEALSYYFQAASYDASLTEAASRVNILTANITSGNMGEDIRNDIEWRDQWRARLAEAEQVYADYMKQQPHYSLVYNVNLKHGETNYSNNTVPISGVTIDLVPDAAWFNATISVVRVMNVVREGLLATGQAAKWGVDWPRRTVGNSPFGSREQNFAVVVELVNSEGKTIGSERITMRSGYDVEWAENTLRGIMPRMRGVQELGFSRVNAYDITTNLSVRIASIDGVDAETAAQTKGINILREAEYARLPEVIAGVDSRGVVRLMEDFEINSSGGITRYKGAAKDVVIPGNIFGIPLTAIGKEAFIKVASVNQYGVNQLGPTGLTSVTILNGITSIGESAFHGEAPDHSGIAGYLKGRPPGITSITIPNSVTSIGRAAFLYNDLTSITIPNRVTSIGYSAFSGNLLTSITMPQGVSLPRGVGLEAFDGRFTSYYDKNGKKAGTYTRPNTSSTKWTWTP